MPRHILTKLPSLSLKHVLSVIQEKGQKGWREWFVQKSLSVLLNSKSFPAVDSDQAPPPSVSNSGQVHHGSQQIRLEPSTATPKNTGVHPFRIDHRLLCANKRNAFCFSVFEENIVGIYNSKLCFGKVNTEWMHVEFCAPLNQESITLLLLMVLLFRFLKFI